MSRIDQTESPFETTAETDLTRWEIYREKLEASVLAPLRILWDDYRSRFGLITVLVYLFAGTVGVMLVEPPVSNQAPDNLMAPFQTMAHPLGSDGFGQDILSLLIHATPPMLKMILSGAVFAIILGTIVGTVSGYKGGFTDTVLTTITDTMVALPGLPLIIVIAAILEPENPYLIGIILSVGRWSGLARALRSEVLTLRNAPYVEAARFMGVSTTTILRKDIIPNLMPYITVNFVGASRGVIFGSVALYFLGILPSNVENWGVMMQRAYSTGGALYTWDTAHWLIFPMATIVWLSLGLIFLAQGADKIFNVRLKARHMKRQRGGTESHVEET
jgi:peptide/nickel transport system permease protein